MAARAHPETRRRIAVEAAEGLSPDDATIAQNRLVLEKLREPEDPALFLALHRRYGQRFVPTRAELFKQVPRRSDGPLRIAYLGVDAHTALQRFVPMLATHHDRTRFHAAFFYGASDEDSIAAARSFATTVDSPRIASGIATFSQAVSVGIS